MIVKILLIYLIIINFYFFAKITRTTFRLDSRKELFITTCVLIFFMIGFFGFVRVLGLFREHNILDVKSFFINYDIVFLILCVVLAFWIKKNVMYFIKYHWIRFHFFYMCDFLPMHSVGPQYRRWYFCSLRPVCVLFYNKTYWLEKVLSVVMIGLLLWDLFVNNGVLNYTLGLAPWYGLFKFLYNISYFVAVKQNLELDYYLYCRQYLWFLDPDNSYYGRTFADRVVEYHEYDKRVFRS